jgi:hypothetical protein
LASFLKELSIDTYKIDIHTCPEYDRGNIPSVGMAQYDIVARPEKKYN